ncbi:MAG TPA: HAD hydrolase-like protein [Acidimicrobiales bacterium]|nr:HAD hydrolase-like protein [Acidimicrobiales bacterium]
MTWALDLDGVVWLGETPIAGSAEAVGRLRRAGTRVVFTTNNSSMTVEQYAGKLARCGIEPIGGDVLTSAQAAAMLLEPGSTALVCAGSGVEQALAQRGVRAVRGGPADAVVVGWHRDFDFDRLAAATTAVLGGARLVGTNDDPTYPAPEGQLPGAGAILAAVAYASGATPVVAGKPNGPMVDLIRARVGEVDVVAGDRPSTDGLLARGLGARFGLVLSGVIDGAAAASLRPAPDYVAEDLAALVAQWEAGRSR